MMKPYLPLLAVLLILTPAAAALDMGPQEIEERRPLPTEHWVPWSSEDTEEIAPWWERTYLDQNRNGIADVLDPYAELPVKDHILTDITISYSRDLTGKDLSGLDSRGFEISVAIELINAVALRNVPTYRIYELLQMKDVVFVEPLGIPVLFADIANPTVRAKGSDMYSPDTAWDMGYTGEGVSLAVIDTGVDDEHPSLSGKFLGGVDMTKPDNLPFLYPQDGSFNPDDIQGHGSTCSGIAIGTGGTEELYQGPGKDARLVDVRIGTKIGYAPGEFWIGALSDPHLKDGTLRGIEWATEMNDHLWENGGDQYRGIDIFSISWGIDIGSPSDGTDQYSRLLDAAVDNGVIVVNAAGNEGPFYTGFHGLSASSKAIIVGATDDKNTLEHEDDVIAIYSTIGPRADNGDSNPYDELKPDVAAPGTNITQLRPDTTRITGDASGNGYGNRGSGTSYATPLVAGVITLMLEANPELEGENELVKEILKYTAEKKQAPTFPELDPFWETDFGYGSIDAYNAVRLSLTVENANEIVPELQAHITNITSIGEVRPYFEYNTSSTVEITGLGWSRDGDFQRTEYRVDEGQWEPVDEQSTDLFNPWSVKIEDLDIGSHRVYVRTVSSEGSSLMSWVDLNVVEKDHEGSAAGSTLSLALFIIAAVAAVGAGAYIIYRKRKVTSSE